jgi:hypothetical protein
MEKLHFDVLFVNQVHEYDGKIYRLEFDEEIDDFI